MRARLTTAAAGSTLTLTLVASLSGCMTVHGEEAVVPAASEEEAEEALERYVEISNEASRAFDPELNSTVEIGPLGAIREAQFASLRARNPGGDQDFTPLAVNDTQFHIPQQAGWPKFFVADTQTNQDPDNRWMLVFTRDSLDAEWNASYVTVLPTGRGPELAEDEDGYLDDLPVTGETDTGLAVEPGQLPTAYTEYLANGSGPFNDGAYTSDEVAAREEANGSAAFVMDYQDVPPDEDEFTYRPVAMRTADGGALVLFSTLHNQKQTMAEGQTIEVHEAIEPLLSSPAERALTVEQVAMFSAVVPEGEGDVELLFRSIGVVSAAGE
ncbi:hypothetical protein [Streptomyces sp. PT12]|uniref:hypothetical protein n=1 Tax=Streptomyces sp. PT12 TaxID=1510197 RepID=UPI0011BE96D6|nr:hypothetical protein [Streptomyces sp. PT12]